jgi:5'-methylthioadenosine phosphorylase
MHIPRRTLVISDQAIDFTKTRSNTFYDGPQTTHVSFADPYCPTLRETLVKTAASQGIGYRDGGTMVVVEGPRFSTAAESRMYAQVGADVIGMTQFPEVILARELELCYGNVALVTDYDVGVDDIPQVTHEEVLKVFGDNIDKLRGLLFAAIPEVPSERTCPCATALAGTGHG